MKTKTLKNNLTIEQLCERLNIKGIITYEEGSWFISFFRNGSLYLYDKGSGHLIID